MIFDAPITELGEIQATRARNEIEKLDIKSVIVSPFTRTIQTAQLILKQVSISDKRCCKGAALQQLRRRGAHHLSFLRVFLLNFDHLDECWWHEGEKTTAGSLLSLKRFSLENSLYSLMN